MKWATARIPKVASKPIRRRVRSLVELLGWSTLEPIEDVPLAMSYIADICQRSIDGTRREIADGIKRRADKLKRSDDRDDLIVAGELDDLAFDLMVGLDESDDDDDDE